MSLFYTYKYLFSQVFASGNFCPMLIIYENSLNPDQAHLEGKKELCLGFPDRPYLEID